MITAIPLPASSVPAAVKASSNRRLAQPGLLAIDLGTTTGWALRTPDARILSGTISFKPSRYDGGGMRYLRFRGWLDGIATDAAGITAVYFEEVRRHVVLSLGFDHAPVAPVLFWAFGPRTDTQT